MRGAGRRDYDDHDRRKITLKQPWVKDEAAHVCLNLEQAPRCLSLFLRCVLFGRGKAERRRVVERSRVRFPLRGLSSVVFFLRWRGHLGSSLDFTGCDTRH